MTISMLVAVVLYDRLFMPFMQRLTKNPRDISLLQRMGVGLVIHIVIMGIASVTERHRLAVARDPAHHLRAAPAVRARHPFFCNKKHLSQTVRKPSVMMVPNRL